ncbi:hypothetical protein DPV78_007542 [Talaromyces pinophilus]|nr:hypothetical protein DPV78_007542 [Talaromyces pinophilus]
MFMGEDGPSGTLDAYKRSLSFPEMYSRYYGILSTFENATCSWLSDCKEYKKWREDGGLLWIKGKPASGKSTLMRYIFDKNKSEDDQENNANKNTDNQNKSSDGKNLEIKQTITLSFFFHGRGSSLQKTKLGFYRTVLFQLLEEQSVREKKIEALSNLEKIFKHQCDSRGPLGKSWHWETSQLAQDFQSVLTEVLEDHLVYLYIDALDECGEDDARRMAEAFEKMIQRSPIKRFERRIDKATGKETEEPIGRRLHVCCSCRNPPLLIGAMVKDTFQICVERHNGHGIDLYVWSHLDQFVNTAPEIPETIVKHSEGVFKWTYLVVERVKTLYSRGFSRIEIEESIDKTPRDLLKLYEDIFQNMLGNEKSLRLICWIFCADEPLALEELRWAMFLNANPSIKSWEDCQSARKFPCDCFRPNICTCKVMERRIQSLGHGFVGIKDSDDKQVVKFIHPSVQEFFLHKNALVRLYNSTSNSTLKNHNQVVKKVKKSMVETCDRYNRMMELIRKNSSQGLN